MSWSTSRIVMPASMMLRSRAPRAWDSAVSRPAAGSSMQTSFGRAASARAALDQLALTLRQLVGHPVGQVPEVEHVERVVHAAPVPGAARVDEVAEEAAGRLPFGGHLEVLAHGEVVEELQRLPGPTEAETGAPVGGQARDLPAVEMDAPARRDEARDAVDERRLARAVRADEADEPAGLDDEVDLVDGPQAAERHGHPGGGEERHQRPPALTGNGSDSVGVAAALPTAGRRGARPSWRPG